MNNKIPQIRQELDRRFKICSDPKTTFWGFLVFAQNYTDFVNNTSVLTQIVESEMKKFKKNFKGLNKTTFDSIDDGIIPIAYTWFNKETKRLVAEQKELKKESFWTSLLKKIKDVFIPRRSEEHRFRTHLNLIHDFLMKALSAHEIGLYKHTAKEPSEVVRSLEITNKTTWEELTISFTNDYDVKITRGEKEYPTNHEKMGFGDNRKPNETHPVNCWQLLQLLAIGNGTFKLSRDDDKEKRKKQKQELTDKLKEYFQINSDPFNKVRGAILEYKIKINIIPSQEFRDDWRDRKISESTSRPELLRPTDLL